MTSSLDLIPWEQQPEALEQTSFTVEWNGGKFLIPRLGYLTVDELDHLGTADPKNALNRLLYETSIELSKAIDDKEDPPTWTAYRCFQLLMNLHFIHYGGMPPLTPEEKTIEILYQHIILPFIEKSVACQNRVVIRSVSIMLQRIKPGWTDEETRKLPSDLRSSIHAHFVDEQNAGKPQLDPAEQIKQIEDLLGKPIGENPSTVTDPTGANSIGTANDSGQAAPNSTEKTLAPSQVTTSFKPLKQAGRPKGNLSTAKSLPSAS